VTDEELNEKFDHLNTLLQGLSTQLNTAAQAATTINLMNTSLHLQAALISSSAFSIIPAGQLQTTSNAVIKKGDAWDYAPGRKVVITCAAWGIHQQRTITKVIKDGNYASVYFNAPLGLPLAENDRIYPLPW